VKVTLRWVTIIVVILLGGSIISGCSSPRSEKEAKELLSESLGVVGRSTSRQEAARGLRALGLEVNEQGLDEDYATADPPILERCMLPTPCASVHASSPFLYYAIEGGKTGLTHVRFYYVSAYFNASGRPYRWKVNSSVIDMLGM
jgi:hypothetical protein